MKKLLVSISGFGFCLVGNCRSDSFMGQQIFRFRLLVTVTLTVNIALDTPLRSFGW